MPDLEFEISLCRNAIDQTYDCEPGRLLEVVEVSFETKKKRWSGKVFTLHLERYPISDRCYAWLESTGPSSLKVHAVLHSEKINSAEIAVRSRLRKQQAQGGTR